MTVFRALSDPTRRRILELLRERDMSAGELAEHFSLSKPTLSRHFAVLREAELIHGDRHGTTILYQLNVSVLEEALLGFLGRLGVGTETAPPTARAAQNVKRGSKHERS